MAILLAYCGLDCAECDARKATVADDNALRKTVAARWSKEYNFACTPEMINCTGCSAPGAKIGHCSDCEIRACAIKKGLANCGACAEYKSCATIGGFLKDVPDAKARLDAIRA